MVGSGSWATALIKLLLNHQESIYWYLRDEKKIEKIKKTAHNHFYLQSVYLDPDRLNMTTDLNEVVENSDVIVFCTPSAYFMNTMSNLKVSLENKFIISAIKGFVDEKNLTVAEYFNQYWLKYSATVRFFSSTNPLIAEIMNLFSRETLRFDIVFIK